MSDPHVLHLIGSRERGGTEHQLVELIRRSRSPRRHSVATFSSIGPLAEPLPVPPVLVGPLGRGFRDLRDDLTAWTHLRPLIRPATSPPTGRTCRRPTFAARSTRCGTGAPKEQADDALDEDFNTYLRLSKQELEIDAELDRRRARAPGSRRAPAASFDGPTT